MKTLTDIAVRLRIISTSLLSILGFIALGLLIGLWLGSRTSRGAHVLGANDQPSSSTVPGQKWRDASHTVPYIPAEQCAGGSSCDRAFFLIGDSRPKDWNAFWANIVKQLQ
jgi:hypothetical protein